MRPRLRLVLLTALFGFSVAAAASAQITATIHGVVRDANGGVLPGANVTVDSRALDCVAGTATTDGQGRYRIAGLRPGDYVVKVELQGFATATLTNVTLQIDSDVPVDVTLQLASLQEAVTVSADEQVVRAKDSDLQELITTTTIDNIPLNGRQFLDLMTLVPGTTAMPSQSDQGANVSVFGERSITNSFLVDGLDNNDPFSRDFSEFFIQDAIQEFKVLLGGYQAEFGRASGAVANVITRSGTNSFRGRAFYYVRDDSMDSSNISGQEPQDLNRQETGGTIGGPIKKGKTFFFDAFHIPRASRPELRSVGPHADRARRLLQPGRRRTRAVRHLAARPAIQQLRQAGSPVQRAQPAVRQSQRQSQRQRVLRPIAEPRLRGASAWHAGAALDRIGHRSGHDQRQCPPHRVLLEHHAARERVPNRPVPLRGERGQAERGRADLPLTFVPAFQVWMSNASPIPRSTAS